HRVRRLPALRPGRLGGHGGPRPAARRGGAVAGRRLRTRTLLRGHLAPDPALVRRPPRRPLVRRRCPGDGAGAGARRRPGAGRAPARGLPGPRPGARGHPGGLEPADRRPGPGADPAALRPGPVPGPGPGRAGRVGERLAVVAAGRLKCWAYSANPGAAMKADIHPEYREVVFQDVT